MRVVQFLLLFLSLFYAKGVEIYITTPVKIVDCGAERDQGLLTVETTAQEKIASSITARSFWAHYDLVQVEGVIGSVVQIPCNVSQPTLDDRILLILWYKDGSNIPIYSYDNRTSKGSPASHWADDRILGHRADFITDENNENPYYLQLSPLMDDDQGLYSCRVDYKRSPTRMGKTDLTVIGLPYPCPESYGFFKLPGSSQCYKIYRGRQKWSDADDLCRNVGLALAEPKNPIQLRQYLIENYGYDNQGRKIPFEESHYWMGGVGTGSSIQLQRGREHLYPGDSLWQSRHPQGNGMTNRQCLLMTAYENSLNGEPAAPYKTGGCSWRYFAHAVCEVVHE